MVNRTLIFLLPPHLPLSHPSFDMCYVGGGYVSLARWEMNKPVCVRSEVRERNAGER